MELVSGKRLPDLSLNDNSAHAWVVSDYGLILLDSSLKPIAFNREAAAILSHMNCSVNGGGAPPRLPEELMKAIFKEKPWQHSIATCFCAGRREYVCRSYLLVNSNNDDHPGMFALLLQRNSSSAEIIDLIASKFGLSERERQVLLCVSEGLSSKESAARMRISPNTIKTYLRLVMVKMGVSTRGEILAKMLDEARQVNFLQDSHIPPPQKSSREQVGELSSVASK